jgi:hypothetical protein
MPAASVTQTQDTGHGRLSRRSGGVRGERGPSGLVVAGGGSHRTDHPEQPVSLVLGLDAEALEVVGQANIRMEAGDVFVEVEERP